MTNRTRALTPVVFALVVVVATFGGVAVLATPAAASTNATLTTSPDDPGVSATHRATATVGSCEAGDSLNKIRVDYSVSDHPADVSGVSASDIQTVGIDTDGDGTIDTNVSDDLSSVGATNNGHTLNLGFGGSYSLYEGDTVILAFDGVQNPDTAGTFDVNVSLNYQSDPVCPSTASLTISQTSADASITADPSTAGSQAAHTVNRTVGSANQGTSLTGFTVEYAATNATGLSPSDVTTAGLDTDSDDSIETNLGDSLTGISVTNSGATVTFSFDGTHSLSSGDRLVLAYDGVTNPSSGGDYTVSTGLNGTSVSATLSISASSDSETDPNATLTANPTTAGATAVHTATIDVGANDVGDSLNKLRVDYSISTDPADVSAVGTSDIQAVGIDTDGDGTIDQSVSDDLSSVSASNDGRTLNLGFGGSYSLSDGDTVVVEYADVTNPNTSGTFDVAVSLNYQSDPVTRVQTTLEITANETSDSGSEETNTTTVQLGMQTARLQAQPSTAAVNGATHVVRAPLSTGGPDAPLQAVTIDYTASNDPADVGDFSRRHIERVGVDTDGDGTIDRGFAEAVSGVSTTNHGETVHVSFDGSATIAEGEILVVRYTDVQNPAGEGQYDVAVTVSAAGQRADAVASLAVEAGNSSSEAPAVAVSVNGSTATAVIQNARPGEPVSMELTQQPTDSGLTVGGMTLTFTERTNASLRIDATPSQPVDVTGADVAHFTIQHGTVNLSSVDIRFYVGKQTLSSRGIDPQNVVLVRRHNDEWQVLDTTVIGSTDTAYQFQATAPGLSTFAVSSRPLTESPKPVFRVTETDLAVESHESGKHVRIVATIRNVGTANGTFDAQLTANGAVLVNRSLTLAAGETGQLTFGYNLTRPAVYDIAVSGTDAGVVEIDPQQTPIPEQTPSPTKLPIPPLLLALLAVTSLAAFSAWIARLR